MNRLAVSICLLAAFAWLGSVHAEDRATSPAPEQVIRNFYHWYVAQVVSNHDPLSRNRQEVKRYATDRLLREIDRMRKGPDGLDGDYFLDAQEFDKDWGRNITVSVSPIKGDRATAEVELKGAEVGTRKLHVSLAREAGTWKVDKVEGKH